MPHFHIYDPLWVVRFLHFYAEIITLTSPLTVRSPRILYYILVTFSTKHFTFIHFRALLILINTLFLIYLSVRAAIINRIYLEYLREGKRGKNMKEEHEFEFTFGTYTWPWGGEDWSDRRPGCWKRRSSSSLTRLWSRVAGLGFGCWWGRHSRDCGAAPLTVGESMPCGLRLKLAFIGGYIKAYLYLVSWFSTAIKM